MCLGLGVSVLLRAAYPWILMEYLVATKGHRYHYYYFQPEIQPTYWVILGAGVCLTASGILSLRTSGKIKDSPE